MDGEEDDSMITNKYDGSMSASGNETN